MTVDWAILWKIIAVLLVIIGMVGTILPALPGVALVFAGLVLFAWVDGFATVSIFPTLAILGGLTAVAYILDFIAASFGTKRMGATPRAFWGAAIGAVAGAFFFPWGLLLGPFLGAVVGELSAGRQATEAGRAGMGAWLGLVLGVALKFGILFLMIGIFIAALATA